MPRCTIWPLVGPTGSRAAEPLAHCRGPGATGDGDRPARHVLMSLHFDGVDVPHPSATRHDAVGRAGHEGHAPSRRGLPQRRRHAASVDPCRRGRVQHAVHRAERGEERARLLGRDLDHVAGRAAEHHLGKGGEPFVFGLAQADGEDAARAVARPVDIGAVGRQPAPAGLDSAVRPGAGTATGQGRFRRS